MGKEDILLRALINAPLVTKGSEITINELDQNWIEIYNALVALSNSSFIPAYDVANTYVTNTPVSYNNQLYKMIFATPIVGVTPDSDPTKWEVIYASDLVDTPKGYKSYFANLNQVAMLDPVVNFEKSEFAKPSLWTRTNVGEFNIESAGAFPDGNKIGIFGGTSKNNQLNFRWTYAGVNNLKIHTVKPDDGTEPDGIMSLTPIEIRVYD